MADDVRWYLLFLRRYEIKTAEIFKTFRERGIEPMLIKGWAAAKFYPPDAARYFSDIDVAVSDADYPKAAALLNGPLAEFGIDLHRELRHLDKLPWEDLLARSELPEVNGTGFRVLCPEDHLRVMCVHWLTDGGEYKERLWDIYHVVDSTRDTFDWDKCLAPAGPTRRKWITSVIGLAHRYLGLDISDLPIAAEANDLPVWLINAVEKAWASDVRLIPLQLCIGDRRKLLQQIRKRLPPNPVQATIDVEGEFDNGSRIPYQFRDFFLRASPWLRRIIPGVDRRRSLF